MCLSVNGFTTAPWNILEVFFFKGNLLNIAFDKLIYANYIYMLFTFELSDFFIKIKKKKARKERKEERIKERKRNKSKKKRKNEGKENESKWKKKEKKKKTELWLKNYLLNIAINKSSGILTLSSKVFLAPV